MTLTDSSGTALSGGSTTGATLTYTAPYSGFIRFYSCRTSGSTANLTVSIAGGTNTQDDATDAGDNVWVEHIYQRIADNGGSPDNTNAFSRYLGYRDTLTGESFSNDFGGTTSTYAVKSGGRYLILSTNDYFAVRYRMQSTRPAGAYIADMRGDDGIRLTVDGTKYFDHWIDQSPATYAKQLFPLSGNSNLLYEYYETAGGNEVGFTNMARVSNAISVPSNRNDTAVCINAAIAFTGNNTFAAAPLSSTTGFSVTYQWVRSVNGGAYSAVSNGTGQDHTTPQLAVGTYLYRRVAAVSRTNDGMSSATTARDSSDVITVTVRPAPIVTVTGGTVCQNESINVVVTNPRPYPITVGFNVSGSISMTGAQTVGASSSASFPFPTDNPGTSTITATSLAYSTGPACSVTPSGLTATVTVRPLPAGTIGTNTPICLGTLGRITFNATSGTGPYSLIINGNTYNGITSGTPFGISPNPTINTTYNLTQITDANGCISP
jgi:hypothetical protein